MSTKALDRNEFKSLQPATSIWKNFYTPENAPYRFQASDLASATEWQQVTRTALKDCVGWQDIPATPLLAQKVASVDKGDYTREKWLLQTGPDMLMPVYILIPTPPLSPSMGMATVSKILLVYGKMGKRGISRMAITKISR